MGDDARVSLSFLYIAVHPVPPSGDDSAGKEADRYRLLSAELDRVHITGRGCFPRRVIRPGGDGRKCNRPDRAVRLRLNGCRSGKYREAESSPSLRSIAVAPRLHAILRGSRKLRRRVSIAEPLELRLVLGFTV